MLIVLEGLDGAGKSTQVKLLREYLSSVLPNLEYIHFPRYDAPVYGPLIGKFLRGGFGSISAVHPQLVALLFAEDRRTAADRIREILSAGGTVLLDRYVYSNIAYQCAKLSSDEEAEELRQWIFDTEYGDFGIPRPDLNIFLDVPIGFVENSLVSARSGGDREYLHGGSDIHEADISFQRRVKEFYLKQAGEDPSFISVDCAAPDGSMLPPADIFAKIRKLVDSRLK
ncbi:MAG: thymidylate kinase [Bacteroidales bacterium]|nr:thymidylate kinase [Bacteroidales bacterium]